jgi:hypothetical protein
MNKNFNYTSLQVEGNCINSGSGGITREENFPARGNG